MSISETPDKTHYMRDYMRRWRSADWKPKRTVWLGDKWPRAQAMRKEGFTYQAIAEAIGLTGMQVYNKFQNEAHRPTRGAALETILRERDALISSPRTLTQIICGDPLPGRSALDRKRDQQPPNLTQAPSVSCGFKVGLSE